MRFGFTGDVMLGRHVNERQRSRPGSAVWGDALADLRSLDGVCVNLECCLSTRGTPWQRTRRAFHFRADPDWAVPALREANVSVAALANNHVLDYEEPALLDTLDALEEGGIAYAGAGRDAAEAFRPATASAGDCTVGVLSLTDNTPEYAASEDGPGTAHVEMDPENAETRAAVRGALDALDADLVVASLHWGPNMREHPPDRFREFAHWLVDEGVDVVHGHSAHVFQGVEDYRGRPVVYDAGDFVDDYAVDFDLRNDRSFLYELHAVDGRPDRLVCHPTEIRDCAVHRVENGRWWRDTLRDRSADLDTDFERSGEGLAVALGD